MTRMPAGFADAIVAWQVRAGRRDLPWQGSRDPYRVWLSEVMLQQTQVATVIGYYARFLDRFPDVHALAAASLDEVLALWGGLGYYSRARNLHRCAQVVSRDHAGVFPPRAADLAELPGIGRSTAAAIAAFCHGERAAILDGNVRRVLARVLGFGEDLSRAANLRRLWTLAEDLLPRDDLPRAMAGYTQGLMDLGATVCLPRRTDCSICPVRACCAAAQAGNPLALPRKAPRKARRAESLWLLQAVDGRGRVWLERRADTGIWAGLHALPVFGDRAALLAGLPPGVETEEGAAFVHVLTHRDLHLHPVRCTWPRASDPPGTGRWCSPADLEGLGLPTPIRRLLTASPGESGTE